MTRIALPLFSALPPGRRFIARILGRLLHVANAKPPLGYEDEFYWMKHQILLRFGHIVGVDAQKIVRLCRVCDGTGIWRRWAWNADTCERCFGSGVYRTDYYRLDRWEMGGYTFHLPAGDFTKEEAEAAGVWIVGRVTHADYGRRSLEAALWLSLFFAPQLFPRLFPLSYAGRLIMRPLEWLSSKLPRRCACCDRRIWRKRTNSCLCRECLRNLPF